MTPRHAPIRLPSLPQLRLRHISELQPGTKVLIFARVSHDKQRKNLGVQARRLRRECTKRGLEVMMVIKKVQSAKLATEDQFYGSWLRYAVEVAQQHGWAIIAESESRLLRHPDFDPEHFTLVPTERDWQHLAEMLDGAPVYVLQRPGSTPRQIRRRETIRGMHGKGKKGGRPLQRKKRFEKYLPKVLRRHCRGWKLRQIQEGLIEKYGDGARIGITAIWRWIKRYG